jgi:hypothetical protein
LHNDLTVMHYDVIEKSIIYYVISWIRGVPRRVSDYDIIEKSAIYHVISWIWGVPRRVSDYDIIYVI